MQRAKFKVGFLHWQVIVYRTAIHVSLDQVRTLTSQMLDAAADLAGLFVGDPGAVLER